MQPTISRVLFYSLIFAIGLAPTATMWIMKLNQVPFNVMAFSALTIVIAAVVVPIILIQNAYLFYKRYDAVLDAKLGALSRFYLLLNMLCGISWVVFIMWK